MREQRLAQSAAPRFGFNEQILEIEARPPFKGREIVKEKRKAARSSVNLSDQDFGLRVRVETHSSQRCIFSGAESLSVQDLVSEVSELVSSLRVRSFALRSELERVTSALMVNVDCGFRPLAQRAALILGDLLSSARKRRLADAELSVRGANAAFRIADLLGAEEL